MSTTLTVCQGLQSCLEPILLQQRVIMHQLVPSKQTLSFPCPPKHPEPPKTSNKNDEDSLNCWNFTTKSGNDTEKAYIHPLSKRSTSSLSSKSLEMCTESLGSETGSHVDSTIDEYSYAEQSSYVVKEAKTPKKARHVSTFPPPLTSISGSEGLQVQTHREGGRLVIKAFSYSCCNSYFRAERQNGRLRLSLLRNGGGNENDDEEEVDQENGEEGGDEWGEFDQENAEEEGEMKGGFWGENMKDEGGKVGWSSSRCNDDKRLPNWPYWVAIS